VWITPSKLFTKKRVAWVEKKRKAVVKDYIVVYQGEPLVGVWIRK